MKFVFKAGTPQGEIKEGIIEAASRDSAVALIQKNGLFLLSIKEEERSPWKVDLLKHFERVTIKEVVIFFRQLATLIGARVPIISALAAIEEQEGNPYFKRVLRENIKDIEDGAQLSDAFEKHPDVYPVISINIIRAGEASGGLRKSVEYIADNIEKNYQLTSRVKAALIYPTVIIAVFLVVGALVMTFVVPGLLKMVEDLNVQIPWYTKVLMSISGFFSSYWWALLIVIIGVISVLYYYLKTAEGKYEWDRIKIKMPIVGKLFKNVYITRFAENLALLLSGGIPIVRALSIVSAVTGNSVYEKIFLSAADEVKLGGSMSEVLKKYPDQIPAIVTQMIRIGEESGQTDLVLTEISKFYEQETDNVTRGLITIIEPLLIVMMGVSVGLLAIAVIKPIYDVSTQIQ